MLAQKELIEQEYRSVSRETSETEYKQVEWIPDQDVVEFVGGENRYHEKIGTQINKSGNLLIIQPRFDIVPRNLSNRRGINLFSTSSGVRMRRYLRECVSQYKNMVTLTYPHNYERDGRKSKNQLRRFIQELKRYTESNCKCDKPAFSIFWFMEFQDRGAIHYHMFTTHDYPHKFIANTWYRICGTDDPRHLAAGSRIEKLKTGRKGTISYASKYAAKQAQKVIPDDIKNAGRFWGVSGFKGVVSAALFVSQADKGVKAVMSAIDRLVSLIKCGLASGEIDRLPCGSGDTRIYVINNKQMEVRIGVQIQMISITASIHGEKHTMPGVFFCPELYESDNEM